MPELAEGADAWKTAMTTARAVQALPHDPRYGEFTRSDDLVYDFELLLEDFVCSPAYATLDVGSEDSWLEGHMRFVIARALARLVADGAFGASPRAPRLHVGYAYPDSGDALIVAIVER